MLPHSQGGDFSSPLLMDAFFGGDSEQEADRFRKLQQNGPKIWDIISEFTSCPRLLGRGASVQ